LRSKTLKLRLKNYPAREACVLQRLVIALAFDFTQTDSETNTI